MLEVQDHPSQQQQQMILYQGSNSKSQLLNYKDWLRNLVVKKKKACSFGDAFHHFSFCELIFFGRKKEHV
jgi:hypothetical protein